MSGERTFKPGDLVHWVNADRRGVRRHEGEFLGDHPSQFTHVRVRTANGVRTVRRYFLHHGPLPTKSEPDDS